MRIRTVKPEFWQSEDLAECSVEARLLAIGLLNMADDEGYMKCHKALIRSQLFPFDDSSLNIQGMLNELSNANFVTLLSGDDGKEYLHVNNFLKHQKVNRPTPSKINGFVELTELSMSTHSGKGKERKGTGKGMERKGKEGDLKSLSENSDAISVLSYLNETLGTKYKATTTSHIENINARISEGHTVEDCKQVIEFKKSEWFNDPKMASYLRPQTLFSTKNFQGYLIASRAAPKGQQSIHNLENKIYESGDL